MKYVEVGRGNPEGYSNYNSELLLQFNLDRQVLGSVVLVN